MWSLPAFSINERQESLWDGLHQSLAQFLVLVNLTLYILLTINLLILHTVLPGVFYVSTGSFLFVCDPPAFEHLHAVVNELEQDDTFDLGEVKLR